MLICQLSQRRREMLKPFLNKEYAALCFSQTAITSLLFGDELRTSWLRFVRSTASVITAIQSSSSCKYVQSRSTKSYVAGETQWIVTSRFSTKAPIRGGHTIKALLHYATCLATCLAILLRHKLQAKLQGVTCLAILKSRNIFVATSIARSRIRFYFSQRLPQRCNAFFKHCTV